MKMSWKLQSTLLLAIATAVSSQTLYFNELGPKCPKPWVTFQETCYRFMKSYRPRDEASRNCQAYQADLLSINSLEEHAYILRELLQENSQQHRKWYTGARMQGSYWTNEDGTQLVNMDNAFLPERLDNSGYGRDHLVYGYSEGLMRWGLEKVGGREAHYYICEAPAINLQYLLSDDRTFQYGIEVSDPLKVPRGPYFIKQPEDRVFDVTKRSMSNDISLSCLAGGYPTPEYDWFKETFHNDRLVAKRIDPLANNRYTLSGGTLIIFNPNQTEDRGSYHCKARNKFGTIRSESVDLSFGYILEFNFKRPEVRGDEHWGKVVYCDPPQHYPGVKYYWARGAFPYFVDDDNERLFVSNDGSLYFSALEKNDQANYSCNVQSTASDTGRNGPLFPLYVDTNLTPQNLKFPKNFPKVFPEAPIAGDQVRMECIAFGFPVPSYNWTRVDGDLPRGSYLMNHNRVLMIPRVKIEDQGEYVCRARNEKISIKSSVHLLIQAAPNFTVPLADKHMDNRGQLTWVCEAFGMPDVGYNWLKNGEYLDISVQPEDRERYFVQDNVLKIVSLDPERDEAMYQCEAKNQLKTKYSSAQLRILSLKPTFKKRPLELETYAAEGGNVTIMCNPEAAPKPKFTWKKDGNVLGSGGRRRILESGSLIISPVSTDDEGTYVCQASNQYGSDESRGRLIVLNAPRFIESLPQRIVGHINQNITLRCSASVDEMLDVAYIWMHNEMRIRNLKDLNPNPRIVIDAGQLDIINATFAEAGDYECIVKSAVGRISSRTSITIDGPPGPTGGVQVVNVARTSVTLTWTDGASNGRPINRYAVDARTNWNRTWVNITEDNQSFTEDDRYNGRKRIFLENVLNPYTTYEFRVMAGNELGYGPPSMPSPQYSTPSDKPSKAPANIRGGGGKIGDLTIKWDVLKPAEQNGPNVFYKIFWRRKRDESEFQSLVLKDQGNVGSAIVHIQSQYYYTEYEVRVQAANAIGYGPKSEIVTIYSAEDMPQVAPQKVYAMSYNGTALNVTWDPIEQTRQRVRGKLIGHRIKYWQTDKPEEDAVYYLSRTTRPWAIVVGLQPNTYYWVKVMAYNSAGEGPESERFRERTYRKAPQNPPSSVRVTGRNPTSVRVSWRYVQNIEGEEPVIGFKIRVWETDQDMSTARDTYVPTGKIEAIIEDLGVGKEYYLRVLAYSNGGDGRMSSPAYRFRMGDDSDYGNSASGRALDAFLVLVTTVVWWVGFYRV